MRHILLGERTGLRVSEVALGTGRLGSTDDGGFDASLAETTLKSFLDAGGNLIDTSSAYQGGRAEEMIGKVLSGSARDAAVISTKFGRTPSNDPPVAAVGTHRRALAAEVEGSLKRLRTDRIDLLFAHFDDGITPVEELMRGLDDLVRAGKVLYIGLSNFPAWRIAAAAELADAHGRTPLAVLQLQYSLLERAIEREHLPLARAKGMGLMAWSPLAGGLLTGNKSLDQEEIAKKYASIEEEQAQEIVDAVVDIARDMGTEPANVAVAWVAARDLIPIMGPRNPDQLAGNLKTTGVRLDASLFARLDEVSKRPAGYPYDLLDDQREKLGIDGPQVGRVL